MPKATHSEIWNEFTRTDDGDATCNNCGRIFSKTAGSSTTFLWTHLKHHHTDLYVKYKGEAGLLNLSHSPKVTIKSEFGGSMDGNQNGVKKSKIDGRQQRIGRSGVWKAFRKVQDSIVCTECGKMLKKGKDSTTSFMWSHLRTHHPARFASLKGEEMNDITASLTPFVSIYSESGKTPSSNFMNIPGQHNDLHVPTLVPNVDQESSFTEQNGESIPFLDHSDFHQPDSASPSISDQNQFNPTNENISTVDIGNDISHLFFQQAQRNLTPPKFKFPIFNISSIPSTREEYKNAYNTWRLHCLQREIYFKTYGIVNEEEVKKSTFLMNLSAEAFLMMKKSFEDVNVGIGNEISYDEFQILLNSTTYEEIIQRIETYLR